jgi:hypothetical protein
MSDVRRAGRDKVIRDVCLMTALVMALVALRAMLS